MPTPRLRSAATTTLLNLSGGRFVARSMRRYHPHTTSQSKTIYDLSYATHKNLIKPLTGSKHVSRILARIYMRLRSQVQSIEIMKITEKNSMEELKRKEMLVVNTTELEKLMH